ncbi:MAG: EAL domain-containing protein [Pseudomonadota bacterium]
MLSHLFSAESYVISSHVIAVVLTGLLALMLCLFNLVQERGSPVTRPFAGLSLCVSLWMLGFGLAGAATDVRMANLWASFGIVGFVLLPAAALRFTVRLTDASERFRKLEQVAWVTSLSFLVINVSTDSLFSGMALYSWGYTPLFGSLGILFASYLAGALLANLTAYWSALRTAPTGSSMQRRLNLLLAGATIAVLSLVDLAPIFGVPVVPFGYAPLIGFFTLTTYVTWRYRLVDITPMFVGQQIADNMADALVVFDCDGNVRVMNRAAERLLDGRQEDFVGKQLPVKPANRIFQRCLELLSAGEEMRDVECWYEPVGERRRLLSTTASTMRDRRGHPVAYIVMLRDITGSREAEERIRFMAYHDDLTSLPNRMQFNEKLGHMLELAESTGERVTAMFLDLDRFKKINDTLGHSAGDRLLQIVAERIRNCLRVEDIVTSGGAADDNLVARLGGDEFIIALHGTGCTKHLSRVARRILDALAEPFDLNSHEVFVSGSIGMSVFPDDGRDVQTLLKNADTAMYHAKDAGRNNFQFYNRAMHATTLDRLALEADLRKAFERDEFELHYQPQVDQRDGRIIGSEALLRWRHPERGLVSPAEFIPMAEESGLIADLGEWVMRTACKQTRRWHDQGFGALNVAVNLSERQFRRSDLVAVVGKALEDSGLDPRRLDIELTESIIMTKAESTVNALEALKEMGMQVSVDDFGTGYSSLSYLKRFPIDVIKVDGSFIRDVATDPDDAAITRTIIAMARSLKLEVIAEGVETPQQAEFLAEEGCHLVQGYMFGRPMPADQLTELLQSRVQRSDDTATAQVIALHQ